MQKLTNTLFANRTLSLKSEYQTKYAKFPYVRAWQYKSCLYLCELLSKLPLYVRIYGKNARIHMNCGLQN